MKAWTAAVAAVVAVCWVAGAGPVEGRAASSMRGGLPHFLIAGSAERDSSEHGVGPMRTQTNCSCGWSNKLEKRIVAGSYAEQNEFPWIVALGEKSPEWTFCGGSIVTEWHVLTAAHCTEDALKDRVQLVVIAGWHYKRRKDSSTQTIDVEAIHQHEGYVPLPVSKHDIALLTLRTKVSFNQLVGPVCLPNLSASRAGLGATRQYVKIIGWGATVFEGPGSDILKKVDVRVVPPEECAFMYRNVDDQNPTQMCTYSRDRASCQGDSGGPVVWADPQTNRYTLVGLVSFARRCADASPTVHSDVGHYLPWIYAKINTGRRTGGCHKRQ